MEHIIEVARNQAIKSPMNNKYGAVLLHRGKVVSVGYNYDTYISTANKCCLLCA